MTFIALYIQLIVCTLLCGLIWVVQLVHYPSFHWIDDEKFASFCEFHQKRITSIVGVLMPCDLLLAGLLVFLSDSTKAWAYANLCLLMLIWLVTFFHSMPCHRSLLKRRCPTQIDRLIKGNWLRTASWSIRSIGLTYTFWQTVGGIGH